MKRSLCLRQQIAALCFILASFDQSHREGLTAFVASEARSFGPKRSCRPRAFPMLSVWSRCDTSRVCHLGWSAASMVDSLEPAILDFSTTCYLEVDCREREEDVLQMESSTPQAWSIASPW